MLSALCRTACGDLAGARRVSCSGTRFFCFETETKGTKSSLGPNPLRGSNKLPFLIVFGQLEVQGHFFRSFFPVSCFFFSGLALWPLCALFEVAHVLQLGP